MGIVYRHQPLCGAPCVWTVGFLPCKKLLYRDTFWGGLIGALLGLNRGYIGGCRVYGFRKLGVFF